MPAPSALVGDYHQGPWAYKCLGHIFLAPALHPGLWNLGFLKVILAGIYWAKNTFSTSTFSLSQVTRFPISFSRRRFISPVSLFLTREFFKSSFQGSYFSQSTADQQAPDCVLDICHSIHNFKAPRIWLQYLKVSIDLKSFVMKDLE